MPGGRIVLAAGGTGGHVFPAMSLGKALAARGVAIHFVTDRRGNALDAKEFFGSIDLVRAANPRRGGIAARLSAGAQLALGVVQARRILKSRAIDAVVGFGGYPSVPVVLAASLLGLPIILHEQNAVLGRANRWLVPRAAVLATSFRDTVGIPVRCRRIELTGNPVRPAIIASRCHAYPDSAENAAVSLCVIGGSLGARVLSDVVPAAIAMLPDPLRQRLHVTQQCRTEDLERVAAAYRTMGQAVDLATFFPDIPARLAAAHLVICRSGASTIAELSVIGRPAILIPYPHAAEDHQTRNAAAFAATGAGFCVAESDLDPTALARRLVTAFAESGGLIRAAQAARDFGIPDAGPRLADLVLAASGLGAARSLRQDAPIADVVADGAERRALS